MLKQLLAHNPWHREDAVLLGELYMRSGDYPNALDWLGRAEHYAPGSRSELLVALSYQRLKEMDLAHRYLDLAKRHALTIPMCRDRWQGTIAKLGTISKRLPPLPPSSIHSRGQG